MLCALAAIAFTGAAHAQTEEESAALQRAKYELELATARADLAKLKSDALDAKIKALDLKAADGKTTLGADAGKLEGVMLASRALDKAASNIADNVRLVVPAGKPVALLTASEALDLSAAVGLSRETKSMLYTAAGLIKSYCPARGGGTIESFSVPPQVIGAALSLLRTDTEISGFSMTGADAALVDAIAGTSLNGDSKWMFAKEISIADENNEIVKVFDFLLAARDPVMACRDKIKAAATTPALEAEAKPKLAALDAIVTRMDAFVVRVSAPREGKPSELTAAIMASKFSTTHAGMLALRVTVNQAGGSLLKRANVFTALGAPAVGITGGLVVSWRLFDPADGTVKKAGILVCRTALTNLNAIHKGKAGEPSCHWPPQELRRTGS